MPGGGWPIAPVLPAQFAPPSERRLGAALIFTGHLRDTCERAGGVTVLQTHQQRCHEAFNRSCDVFIHTWDALDWIGPKAKGRRYDTLQGQLSATKSWRCVAQIAEALAPVSIAVGTQNDSALTSDSHSWTNWEALGGTRMNSASIAFGVELMQRHAHLKGGLYSAAVRLRADVGSSRFASLTKKSEYRRNIISSTGWGHVAARARRLLPSREVNQCGHPNFKHLDWCFWSAPAAAMVALGSALHAAWAGGGGAFAERCRNRILASKVAAFSENTLLCAMREANVTLSRMWDFLPEGQALCSCNVNAPVDSMWRAQQGAFKHVGGIARFLCAATGKMPLVSAQAPPAPCGTP